MWTGTSALKDINQSLQTIRNDVVRLDTQLTQLTESLGANKRHRVKLISDMAAVRLAGIQSGELNAELNSADQQAAAILEQRESALQSLNQDIEVINQQLADAEAERGELLEQLNDASQNVVDVEAKVQNALQADATYRAQLEVARKAESVSAEAELKVEQAQTDMAEKAEPYQADDLFMYLWRRGFGTTEYKGGLFSRFMDSWVARLVDYEPARVNFWNLTEIPKRLEEHADRVANVADEAHMALQQLELDALSSAGVNKLASELELTREQLDKHDDVIEEFENQLNVKLEDRAGFIAGEDDYMKRSLERLTQALDHRDLRAISRYVLATHSPTDDHLVVEIQGLDDRLEDVAEDLADVRVLHDNKFNKLKELELVRRNFKNSRYDDVRSGFGNQKLISSVLGQFLQGVVSGADVWRVIKRNQRYRNVGSIPDFGSGGLGDILGGGGVFGGTGGRGQPRRRPRKRRQSTWNFPQPRRGGGGFRIPRGGGGGGFKTGGGF